MTNRLKVRMKVWMKISPKTLILLQSRVEVWSLNSDCGNGAACPAAWGRPLRLCEIITAGNDEVRSSTTVTSYISCSTVTVVPSTEKTDLEGRIPWYKQQNRTLNSTIASFQISLIQSSIYVQIKLGSAIMPSVQSLYNNSGHFGLRISCIPWSMGLSVIQVSHDWSSLKWIVVTSQKTHMTTIRRGIQAHECPAPTSQTQQTIDLLKFCNNAAAITYNLQNSFPRQTFETTEKKLSN